MALPSFNPGKSSLETETGVATSFASRKFLDFCKKKEFQILKKQNPVDGKKMLLQRLWNGSIVKEGKKSSISTSANSSAMLVPLYAAYHSSTTDPNYWKY
ncbi:hypothetical protein OIU77_018325 [Salix suchowensis]|uniref:Uncharacterized protein n=1 Tax=Salix suchowensis TaxID=1278906 RepID=A0ABQ9CC32_9ROSI|nr:hypothetical protein OIU77_018325 [Salix suchowensis]